MDWGGSVLKAVIRSKENVEELQNDKVSKTGHLQLVHLATGFGAEGLSYIAEHASITSDSNPVYVTGLGCSANGKLICDKLNIKIENILEFDCFIKAFRYLAANLSRADLFDPFDVEATKEPMEIVMQQVAMMKEMIEQGQSSAENMNLDHFDPMASFGMVVNDSALPVSEVELDLYPCLLVMAGSGFGFMKVNSDGTFQLLDGSNRGGRTLQGLASILTGCQSYDQVVDLAAKGNNHNVDTFSDELFQSSGAVEGDDSMYVKASNLSPSLLYCFGKGVGSEASDFKPEDIARALVNKTVQDLVQTMSLICQAAGLKRVCLCGSFINSPFIRKVITTETVRRNLFLQALGQSGIKLDFVKAGGHLGALGALITQFEKFRK